jgi:hypothetical protein
MCCVIGVLNGIGLSFDDVEQCLRLFECEFNCEVITVCTNRAPCGFDLVVCKCETHVGAEFGEIGVTFCSCLLCGDFGDACLDLSSAHCVGAAVAFTSDRCECTCMYLLCDFDRTFIIVVDGNPHAACDRYFGWCCVAAALCGGEAFDDELRVIGFVAEDRLRVCFDDLCDF